MSSSVSDLRDGWLELESDPGVFTSLVKDFGVKGVELEEIYDLDNQLERQVYGYIFLFRWMEERRNRRKTLDQTDMFVRDDGILNGMFFARQMIPNSCATHALLSVLLNSPNIDLGETLERIKGYTVGMMPENKGWAIGNTPEIARAHNSHASPYYKPSTDTANSKTIKRFIGEAYHFVSFIPINGHLYEMDGLKPYPMDHGSWAGDEDWTDKFKRIITNRLNQCSDIRFNLMAVVPDNRLAINRALTNLRTNKCIISEAEKIILRQTEIKNICNDNDQHVEKDSLPIPSTSNDFNEVKACLESEEYGDSKEVINLEEGLKAFTLLDEAQNLGNINATGHVSTSHLLLLKRNVEQEIDKNERILQENNEKHNKYEIDNCRRNHNYDGFISTFIAMLTEQRLLPGLIEQQLNSSHLSNLTQVKLKTKKEKKKTSTSTKRKTKRKGTTKNKN